MLHCVTYGANAATVTDAYNSVRGYSFGVVQGLTKTGAITGPACPQCGPAAKTSSPPRPPTGTAT